MRIRFRASDLGQAAKINSILAKSKQASCVKSDAQMVLGSFVCSCDSAVRFMDSENSSQRRLLLCLAPRRDALSALRSALDSSIQACAD